MALMNVTEVAEYLGIAESRVTRLEREHLLLSAEKDDNDEPMFEPDAVAKYKELAERLGGI
ncbi:MAG: helix-turn-helix domain-containing protein [Glaciecola sp.]